MSTNRENLIKIANLVRPALASQAYIPALTHIRFDGQQATAYNDISAISVRCDLDAKRLIPGELLIKALGSFNGESIVIQDGKDGAVVVKSGRSQVKMPTLELAQFPLELPKGKAPEIEVTADILRGIQRCLVSVGNDPTHPAQMGITLDVGPEGNAVLYSTDNFTISCYETNSDITLPGDAPIILPRFFCEQLLKLKSAFPDAEAALLLYDGAIVAELGNDLALIFSKTLVDVEPMDFPKVVKKHCDLNSLGKELQEIPPGFDEALERALLVLSGEVDKATKITPGDGVFAMHSSSSMGDAEDRFSKFEPPDMPAFHVDPTHLSRAGALCDKMAFLPRVVVMGGDNGKFVHLISHVAK
jgi:DNA polymerase III sliding clamp (beta) subunit (PCNA family)